jgi:hypothetical protein
MVRTRIDDSDEDLLEEDELLFEYGDQSNGLDDDNNMNTSHHAHRPKFGDLTGVQLIKEPQFFVLWIIVFFVGGVRINHRFPNKDN